MASPGSRFQYVKKFGLVLGPALFFATILITPIDDTLSFGAIVVVATTLWMATWWITEVIPIYATALLPLGIFPVFGVSTIGDTSANYADPIVFLFLGGFLIAKAIEKSGLHRRFALTLLRVFGTKPKKHRCRVHDSNRLCERVD